MLKIQLCLTAVVFVRMDCYTVIPYDIERDLFMITEFIIV